MEKIKVDYSEHAAFKGASILFPYLEEGLEHVRRNQIKDVCVWTNGDRKKYKVDFDFLADLEFVETFKWIVSLSKKSNLEGLYLLSNLRYFTWAVDNDFGIDFSKLTKIETMNLPYHSGLKNLNKLTNLKKLYIQSVKEENCQFLSCLSGLELLRVINGQFRSLKGLENCKNLREIDLRSCYKLSEARSTLMKLPNLKSAVLDGCKNHDIDEDELRSKVPHVFLNK